MMSWVMRSPFLLAHLQVLRERHALRILDQQVVQKQSAALYVASGLLDQFHQCRVVGA